MIKIAHRGNYQGRDALKENTPDYIEEAIAANYDVMVDAWLLDGKWFLGSEFPSSEVPLSFFERPQIWVHSMNLIGHVSLYNNKNTHVFWHHKDDYTFTSKGIKWANTGVFTHDGVMLLPEYTLDILAMLKNGFEPLGVCSNNFSLF